MKENTFILNFQNTQFETIDQNFAIDLTYHLQRYCNYLSLETFKR